MIFSNADEPIERDQGSSTSSSVMLQSDLNKQTNEELLDTLSALRSNACKTSKYRGVSYLKGKGLWRARIEFDGRRIHLGCFKNEDDAAKKYDEKSFELRGHKGVFNFPEEVKKKYNIQFGKYESDKHMVINEIEQGITVGDLPNDVILSNRKRTVEDLYLSANDAPFIDCNNNDNNHKKQRFIRTHNQQMISYEYSPNSITHLASNSMEAPLIHQDININIANVHHHDQFTQNTYQQHHQHQMQMQQQLVPKTINETHILSPQIPGAVTKISTPQTSNQSSRVTMFQYPKLSPSTQLRDHQTLFTFQPFAQNDFNSPSRTNFNNTINMIRNGNISSAPTPSTTSATAAVTASSSLNIVNEKYPGLSVPFIHQRSQTPKLQFSESFPRMLQHNPHDPTLLINNNGNNEPFLHQQATLNPIQSSNDILLQRQRQNHILRKNYLPSNLFPIPSLHVHKSGN